MVVLQPTGIFFPVSFDIPLFAEPVPVFTPIPDDVESLSPGLYEASEFQLGVVRVVGGGWFKIVEPEGWVREENAVPSSKECFD